MEKKMYAFLAICWTFIAGAMLANFLAGIPIPDWCTVLYAGMSACFAWALVFKS